MDASLLQTGAVAVAAVAAAWHAAHRPGPSAADWLIASILGLVALWSVGIAVQHHAGTDEAVHLGFTLGNLGAVCMAPLWFLVAARYSRLSVLDGRSGMTLALVVPSALLALAIVTNPGHRLFAGDLRLDTFGLGPVYWAGPIYWMFIAWNLGLVVMTSGLFVGSGLRVVSRAERRRAFALAATPLAPIAFQLLLQTKLVAANVDGTPTITALSLGVVYYMTVRNSFQTLPVARRDVIQHLSDGVVVADREGRLLDLNPAACTLLDATEEDLRDRSVIQALGSLAEPSEGLERELRALLRGGPAVVRELESSDHRRIELHAVPVTSADGELGGVALLLRDCTERRRTEHFLRQSQRLETVASLAAGMAHEINNPLAFVRSNLGHLHRLAAVLEEKHELLDEETAGELGDLRQVVEETMEGVERIGTVVSHMQRFARFSPDEVDDVDLNEVVVEAIRLAAFHDNDRVTVETALGRTLPAVRGSFERLVQAVLNLLLNAKQALAAGGAGGRVRVSTRASPSEVEVRVADDGPGVPAGVRERIFDPFFTTRGEAGGAGLGLSIAFDIVSEHGGLIELVPSSQGAVFKLQIPPKAGRVLGGLG